MASYHPSSGSPPHTRGIRLIKGANGSQGRITPAHAGNTLFASPYIMLAGDHPRTRGEYFISDPHSRRALGSPPHTRGIPLELSNDMASVGITPAHAGNTPDQGRERIPGQDHPRTRGEYAFRLSIYHAGRGSPPHTRGILHFRSAFPEGVGITPAHAGNTVGTVK